MTKDNARQYIPLLEALADGELEISRDGIWEECLCPAFSADPDQYRRRPKPVMVPLGPEDVPPGSVVRQGHFERTHWILIVSAGSSSIRIGSEGQKISYEDLQHSLWEISRDGGKTWKRCEKEVKQ